MMSLAEFAAKLDRAAVRAKTEIVLPTAAYMEIVKEVSKASIGTYALGWPELAESTQADRVSKGFPANEPELRTGKLRASIETKTEPTGFGAEGLIYSGEIVAMWQEMGTSKMPPRSFLFKPLWMSTPALGPVFGKFVESLLKF